MRTTVEALPRFKRRLKRLERKYRTALDAAERLIAQLERGERPGSQIQRIGFAVYKCRLRNPAVSGGAPKGYRVIYHAVSADFIRLLTIYSKSEQTDVSHREIRQLVAQADDLPEP